MKRKIVDRVKEFKETTPHAKLSYDECREILEIGDRFRITTTAFYFGYLKGCRAKKGGAS